MRTYPLQTNSRKCAFGHFYHTIQVDHPEIVEDWNRVDEVHHEFHNMGDRVIEAVQQNEEEMAQKLYNEAVNTSKEMLSILGKVEEKLEEMSGIRINVCD